MKLLLYCTKAKPYLREYPFSVKERFYQLTDFNFNTLNGKIVAECDFEVEEIEYQEMYVDVFDENDNIVGTDIDRGYIGKKTDGLDLIEKSRLCTSEF